MERFEGGPLTRVRITPMLAATSSLQPRQKMEQGIRRLYELGADFKTSPADDKKFMHDRLIRDPLYQLIKHQIRDVKQRDIEEFRKAGACRTTAVLVETDAQSEELRVF